jgi:hypothetical protein
LLLKEDCRIVSELPETLSPFVKKKFGEGADHAAIWQESIQQLLLEDGCAPCNDVALKCAMSKLPKVSKTVHNDFRQQAPVPAMLLTRTEAHIGAGFR